jgi:hypothetical protein
VIVVARSHSGTDLRTVASRQPKMFTPWVWDGIPSLIRGWCAMMFGRTSIILLRRRPPGRLPLASSLHQSEAEQAGVVCRDGAMPGRGPPG